jgi:hypothetical protein
VHHIVGATADTSSSMRIGAVYERERERLATVGRGEVPW